VPGSTSDFGVADAAVEVSRAFTLSRGIVLIPYVELGVSYEFERPNDGKILTSDLTFVSSSPWSGSVRAGARVPVTESLFVEAKGGYLSLGQSTLEIWAAGLFVSYGF
jgi:hypothetical protein